MVEGKAPSWEEKFEKKMKKLEERVEEMGKTLEEKGEEFGKRVEGKARRIKKEMRHRSHSGHSLFWGIVLLVVGFLWLGNNLRWFWYDIPWIPVAMIAGGIFLIIKHWEKDPSKSEKSEEKE